VIAAACRCADQRGGDTISTRHAGGALNDCRRSDRSAHRGSRQSFVLPRSRWAHANVLISSVAEGDDKPYKYPAIYRGIDALIINKIDLIPYVDYNMDYFRRGVELLNPGVVTFPISCRTGERIEQWVEWLSSKICH
jgi:hypothetical protein